MKIDELEYIFSILQDMNIELNEDIKTILKQKIFKTPPNLNNLVLWQVQSVYNNKHKARVCQGLITQNEYKKIMKMNKIIWNNLTEIYKDFFEYFKIMDMTFSTDENKIIDFFNSNENNVQLKYILKEINENEEIDKNEENNKE
jgi:hypothetical protein